MIQTIIFDISEINKKTEIAKITFNECNFPQRNDHIVINNTTYVVQKKQYIINNDDNSYTVNLQVKKFIPEKFGF